MNFNRCANYEAYFGQGTKLTVLGQPISLIPTAIKSINVLKGPVLPQCNNKTCLVCVASDFYPDHVSVSWTHNFQNITDDEFQVSTDAAATAAAKKDGKNYKITSRLMVPIKDWVKPNINFTCTVSFFNGTNNIKENKTFTTKGIDNPGMTRESYIKITQNAKISYTVLILKSCLYAALVCLLVWKLQGKRGKQTK
uniref:Ig-like domain-containing protein n=1 Tax=Poecilia formosa TaxID=48698 RepID=A0A096LV50_POEFO